MIRRISLVLGTLATLTTLYAQELSLDQARSRALAHNRKIAQAQERQHGAEQMLRAMKTNYLPKLSVSAYAYYATAGRERTLELGSVQLPDETQAKLQSLGQAMPHLAPILAQIPSEIALPSLTYKLKTGNSYLASAHLTQPIYMGGKIASAHHMARIGVEMANLGVALTQDEVYLATDEAYWQLVEVLELRTTAEAYVKTIAEVHRIVTNAVSAGMRTRADLLRVEVEQSKAHLALERASNGVRLAQSHLSQIVGLPLDAEPSPTDSFPSPLFTSEGHMGDLSTRPEYALLSKQIELKRANTRLVRSDFLPQVGLRASYSYVRGLRINDQLLLDNATPSVMLSLNIPIFSWGEGRAKVRAARTQERIAILEREEMSEKMMLEQQQALNRYHEQVLEVDLTKRTIAQADALLKQTHDRYAVGLDTTAELLEAELIASQARSDHTSARSRLALAATRLAKALGQL